MGLLISMLLAFTMFFILTSFIKRKPVKHFYIIRGIPGSGKSTLAAKMAEESHVSYVETDQFLYNEKGEYEWTEERLSRAIDQCYDGVYLRMVMKEPIVITAGVYSRWRAMRGYIELAQTHGYQVHIIECKGDYGSIHGVPADRLEKIKQKFIPNSGLPQMQGIQYSTHP